MVNEISVTPLLPTPNDFQVPSRAVPDCAAITECRVLIAEARVIAVVY
jgi:hypothetical protein